MRQSEKTSEMHSFFPLSFSLLPFSLCLPMCALTKSKFFLLSSGPLCLLRSRCLWSNTLLLPVLREVASTANGSTGCLPRRSTLLRIGRFCHWQVKSRWRVRTQRRGQTTAQASCTQVPLASIRRSRFFHRCSIRRNNKCTRHCGLHCNFLHWDPSTVQTLQGLRDTGQ